MLIETIIVRNALEFEILTVNLRKSLALMDDLRWWNSTNQIHWGIQHLVTLNLKACEK